MPTRTRTDNRRAVASGRRSQSERTAESARRLVDAAIELIAAKGFERTTVAEIGERAGYSRSMVNARYGSKEALLEALFATELNRRVIPSESDQLEGLPWLLAQLDHVARVFDAERDFVRALLRLSFEGAEPVENLRVWWRRWIEEYEARIAQHLRAGQREGSVRAELDPDREAKEYMLHGLGLVFRWSLDPEGYNLAGEFESFRDRLLLTYAPGPPSQ